MLRIRKGIKSATKIITIYGLVTSVLIILFAKPLLTIFVSAQETEILQIGTQYLFIVSGFYCLIGYLFMFYGLYRGIGKPETSIILTVISLGTRVVLAYSLSSITSIGLVGIWWAIPIGWALADIVGFYKMKIIKEWLEVINFQKFICKFRSTKSYIRSSINNKASIKINRYFEL